MSPHPQGLLHLCPVPVSPKLSHVPTFPCPRVPKALHSRVPKALHSRVPIALPSLFVPTEMSLSPHVPLPPLLPHPPRPHILTSLCPLIPTAMSPRPHNSTAMSPCPRIPRPHTPVPTSPRRSVRIPRRQGGKEHTLRAHLGLPSVEKEEDEGRPPIAVRFEIPYFTVSGIQVTQQGRRGAAPRGRGWGWLLRFGGHVDGGGGGGSGRGRNGFWGMEQADADNGGALEGSPLLAPPFVPPRCAT